MPPVNSAVATKTDLAELRTDLKTEITELRTELKTDIADLKTEITELRTELKTDVAELYMATRTDLAAIKSDMAEMHASLSRQITAAMEHSRGWFRVLDDKIEAVDEARTTATKDLSTELRTELDQHRGDTTVHRVPRAPRRRKH
jgi:SMC interacting uncharacterized protein involved in chromosome segregation